MALVGLAGLVGDHAHDFVALQLRLERAADAAIGAGRHHRALRRSHFDDRLFVERRGRAGLHAGAAGDAFGRQEIDAARSPLSNSKPRPKIVSANVPWTSSQARTQREQTMHFGGVEGEIGIGGVDRRRRDGWRRRSRSARRAGRRFAGLGLQLAVAVGAAGEACRADGRRCRAPSPRAAAVRSLGVRVWTTMPSSAGVVQEAGVPLRPSISTRHRRQEPNASRLSVAHSLGIGLSIKRRGGHHRRSRRHANLAPVDRQRDGRRARADRRAGIEFLQQRHG